MRDGVMDNAIVLKVNALWSHEVQLEQNCVTTLGYVACIDEGSSWCLETTKEACWP